LESWQPPMEFVHSNLDLEGHQFHQVERTIFLDLDYQTMLKEIKNYDLSVMSKQLGSHILSNLSYKGLKSTRGLGV
jgi:hypothetical protein